MNDTDKIIKELETARDKIGELSMALRSRQVRVHPAGGSEVIVTTEYADGLMNASNALNKAIHILKLKT
jgi:hypothetical protein